MALNPIAHVVTHWSSPAGNAASKPAKTSHDRRHDQPSAWHHVERCANNPLEADHGRLQHRLRPIRGSALAHSAGHHRWEHRCRRRRLG